MNPRPVRLRLPAVAGSIFALAVALGPARAERPRVYALTGASVQVAPGRVLEHATIVIRDGLIEAVGTGVPVPPDAVVIDSTGKLIHAGFIDACSEIGTRPAPPARPGAGDKSAAGDKPAAGAAHPIAGIRPERRVFLEISLAEKDREKHRSLGFTSVLAVPKGGIFRGTSALLALGDGSVADNVLRPAVAQHVTFESGNFGEDFPTSLMGAIAAVRQGFLDARRHDEWQKLWDADPRGLKRPDTSSAWAPMSAVT